MRAFNLLRHQSELRAIFALHAIAVNLLPVERLANRLDVFLQPTIGKRRLRGLCGRTGQRARAHGDVAKELRLLIREALLL